MAWCTRFDAIEDAASLRLCALRSKRQIAANVMFNGDNCDGLSWAWGHLWDLVVLHFFPHVGDEMELS